MELDLELAKENPAAVFKRPHDILDEPSLSRKDKIDILQRWAYDEREMAVAEEENMTGPASDSEDILEEIIKCLLELGANEDQDTPPTKQG